MASLEPPQGLVVSAFDNAPALGQVQAVGFDAVSLDWSVAPALPSDVAVEVSGAVLTVQWQLIRDLFPLQRIRYLRAGELHQVAAWAELPPEAEEVIEFAANPTNLRTYTLSVTATGSAGGQPASASGSYQIEIWQQYNVNRDILQEVIDARR